MLVSIHYLFIFMLTMTNFVLLLQFLGILFNFLVIGSEKGTFKLSHCRGIGAEEDPTSDIHSSQQTSKVARVCRPG